MTLEVYTPTADEIIIRPAELSDYGFLCEAFKLSNRKHIEMRSDLYREVDIMAPRWKFNALVLAKYLGYEPASAQIAEIDEEKVGAVFVTSEGRSALSWSSFEKEACIDNVIVLPEHRRHGVGTALVNAAIDWAKVTGHQHIKAKIVYDNNESFALFESAGLRGESENLGMELEG